MIHPTRAALLALVLLLPACSPKTRPAQIFPGLESVPTDRLTTLRESDSVYISSIDGRNAPEPDLNTFTGDQPYRQFQIPAGRHLIAIYYHTPRSQSHSYDYVARLQAGHTYSFSTKVESSFIHLQGVATRFKWYAQLIDDATGLPPSTQPATAPTTKPAQ